MQDVDIVTARMIALLPPSSRTRLNQLLRRFQNWPTDPKGTFVAGPGEFDNETLEIGIKRGKLTSKVRLSPQVVWERHALHVSMDMPDTIIAALRKRALNSIVEHPLLVDLTVTSARRGGDTVIIETARKPLVAVEEINSTGIDRPLDLIETLRAMEITQVCRVTADLVKTVPLSLRSLLASRLAATGRSQMADLVGWLPRGSTSVGIYAKDGKLDANIRFTVGKYSAGTLRLGGTNRSNGRILTGSFFRFKSIYGNNYRQRLKNPYLTLEELEQSLQPKMALAA